MSEFLDSIIAGEPAQAVQRLSKDLANVAYTLSPDEARFLVDYYYMSQRDRIRTSNQMSALSKSGEPHSVLMWLSKQSETLENQIKRALTKYAEGDPVGRWCMSVCGVGPVLTAGLLAHIDIEKAPTVGHIWRFAGLDSTCRWHSEAEARQIVAKVLDQGLNLHTQVSEILAEVALSTNRKVEAIARMVDKDGKITRASLIAGLSKRPWNASLKVLAWKIGESFVKVKNNQADVYGKLYDKRKAMEQARNERGEYADQAAAVLERVPTHAQKATYAEGKLPDGHIHARAKRYAVKQFLADLHAVWYREHFKKEPPLPYPIAILGHAHYDKRV